MITLPDNKGKYRFETKRSDGSLAWIAAFLTAEAFVVSPNESSVIGRRRSRRPEKTKETAKGPEKGTEESD